MRTTCWIAAVLCVSVAVAEDATKQTASTTTVAASAGSGSAAQAKLAARPLHRHPTLYSMLVRNNNIRRRVGLAPHRMNPALTAAAQDHANYMARTGVMDHYTNGGPQARAYRHGFAGGVRENIAMGGGLDTAFSMWVASSGHYASIVSGTTDAGFGYAVSPNGQTFFAGVYGVASAGSSETEEQIAQYLKEEAEAAKKLVAERDAAAKLAAEKTAAENDSNVKPVSATLDPEQKPASEVKPAAATESTAGK
jgi:uncharacterized protein YkwD